jgi:hypothetical protein
MPSRRKPKKGESPVRRGVQSRADLGVQPDEEKNYIIQLYDRPQSFSMDDAQSLLESTGVVLDKGYGPISPNPAGGLFILRGRASSKARQEAEKRVPGIRFFGDAKIGPAAPPVGRPS